jgi:hypothetical protein
MKKSDVWVVRIGGWTGRVTFHEWWPGKRGVQAWITGLQLQLMGLTPKHATFARVDLADGYCRIESPAYCCPRDEVDRAKGGFISLLRLARVLKKLGLRIERA